MGIFGLFRPQPPIRNVAELADFIDQNAAFVVQRGIYEYCRARAGHYAKVLMVEPEFLAAVEESRWRAYPLGLAMVTEVAEGILRRETRDDRRAALDRLMATVLAVFDRYAVPPQLGASAWRLARQELAHRLDLIGTHAPKWAKDVPLPYAQIYFDNMPIHEKLRAPDYFAIHNYLKVSLINIHDELSRRMEVPAVARDLLMPQSFTEPPRETGTPQR
jgi:hypothetical protein